MRYYVRESTTIRFAVRPFLHEPVDDSDESSRLIGVQIGGTRETAHFNKRKFKTQYAVEELGQLLKLAFGLLRGMKRKEQGDVRRNTQRC